MLRHGAHVAHDRDAVVPDVRRLQQSVYLTAVSLVGRNALSQNGRHIAVGEADVGEAFTQGFKTEGEVAPDEFVHAACVNDDAPGALREVRQNIGDAVDQGFFRVAFEEISVFDRDCGKTIQRPQFCGGHRNPPEATAGAHEDDVRFRNQEPQVHDGPRAAGGRTVFQPSAVGEGKLRLGYRQSPGRGGIEKRHQSSPALMRMTGADSLVRLAAMTARANSR